MCGFTVENRAEVGRDVLATRPLRCSESGGADWLDNDRYQFCHASGCLCGSCEDQDHTVRYFPKADVIKRFIGRVKQLRHLRFR